MIVPKCVAELNENVAKFRKRSKCARWYEYNKPSPPHPLPQQKKKFYQNKW